VVKPPGKMACGKRGAMLQVVGSECDFIESHGES
jgi:hypothetical protein